MFEKLAQIQASKTTVTRLFTVAVAFVVLGFVGACAIGIAVIANGAVSFGGPQVVTVDPAAIAGAIAGLAVTSLLTGIGATLAVASWAGALINTARLQDKAWFTALLLLGLVSLGWIAMFAYVLKGPDSTSPAMSASAA